jgi:hypothetical protein
MVTKKTREAFRAHAKARNEEADKLLAIVAPNFPKFKWSNALGRVHGELDITVASDIEARIYPSYLVVVLTLLDLYIKEGEVADYFAQVFSKGGALLATAQCLDPVAAIRFALEGANKLLMAMASAT